MQSALAAVVVAASIGVTTVQACELPGQRHAGETQASAVERMRRDTQASLWDSSDVVFVGELSSIVRQDGIYIEVVPIGALKGEVRSGTVGYPFDQGMLGCGLLSWPTMEFEGVYFANRTPNGDLRVRGVVNYDAIRDQALFDRVNERIGVEPVSLAVRDAMDFPLAGRLPYWAWLAGAAGLSFLAGLGIGRIGPKASNTQNSLS